MTYATFETWMGGATIYIVHDRYGSYSQHGFVAVSGYTESDKLRDAVEDLAGGDTDMSEARDYIDAQVKAGKARLGAGSLPSEACKNLEAEMREWQQEIIGKIESEKQGE